MHILSENLRYALAALLVRRLCGTQFSSQTALFYKSPAYLMVGMI
jgi:hypothetical protein